MMEDQQVLVLRWSRLFCFDADGHIGVGTAFVADGLNSTKGGGGGLGMGIMEGFPGPCPHGLCFTDFHLTSSTFRSQHRL